MVPAADFQDYRAARQEAVPAAPRVADYASGMKRPAAWAGAAALVLLAAGPVSAAGRPGQPGQPGQLIEPDQQLALGTALGLPQALGFGVSADGRRVVLAASTRNRSTLFLAAAGARPGPLTEGRRWDSAPRFVGDAMSVVFVSGRRPRGDEPETGRLFRLTLGGEPEPLTAPDLEAYAPAVDPAGERIAFLGGRATGDESVDEPDTGRDIWLVSANGGAAERRTEHPGDEGPPAWSPDGTRLAYSFASGDGRELAVLAVEAGSEPVVVTSGSGRPVRGVPDWTPDGAGLAWASGTACTSECPDGGFDAVYFAPAGGTAPPYPLLAGDRDLAEPRFRPAGNAAGELEVAWIEADRGSRRIHRSRLQRDENEHWSAAGRVRIVTRGAGVARGLRWSRDGSRLFALHEAPAFPRDVWSFPITGGRERITDTLFPEVDVRSFSRPERIEVERDDGVTVGAFLYRPVPASERAPAPLLVHVRGKAGDAWRNGFDPIVQLLTAQGYAVLAPNVRGTGGRGAAFAALNDGDWGASDLDDLVAATRAAQALPDVSADTACIFGVEYGGFLALAALARHPDAFACGVEAMGFADPRTLYRTLDPRRQGFLERELGPVRGNLENYRRLSLNGAGAAVRAPLLSFHGEEVPEIPLAAKSDFLEELRSRSDYPLVEFYFRGDSGRSVFRWETDRGAAYAFLEKILEFLSLHLPAG